MGLQLPGALTEPLSWVGLTWPEADEDLLYEAGREWTAFAGRLREVAAAADRSAGEVWGNAEGDAVDAFHQWWIDAEGPQQRISDDAVAAEIIGAALLAFAAAVLAMKVAFIAQLVTLAVEVAQAIATAFVSFGATTAEIPAFVAASRVICRRLIKKVLEHIQTIISDLLKRAKDLLRRYAHKGVHTPEALTKRLEQFEAQLANDLRRVNPNFRVNDPEFGQNCTHCVQAFEIRRRGYDVHATPLPPRYWPNPPHWSGGRPLQDIETSWGRNFSLASHQEIIRAFENAGPGARGVVAIRWHPGLNGGGHVFNVENVAGKVRFVDGQNGATDVAQYFRMGFETKYVRLDDLTPGNLAQFVASS